MFDGIYYGGPEDFTPVNAAYLQLQEEIYQERVEEACDYISRTYGDSLTVRQMEDTFDKFEIPYHILPKWLQDEFDNFDIID